MQSTPYDKAEPDAATPARLLPRVGCVRYLNAKPLIAGLDQLDAQYQAEVPGRLLASLEAGEVELALCPVIDFFRSTMPLKLVPVGGIGCEGPTLTVRLFSRVPIEHVSTVYGDVESHTSVALLRVLLAEQYDRRIKVVPYDASAGSPTGNPALSASAGEQQDGEHEALPEALLLIGDKVVTAAPDSATYPYQLDLGEAWYALTGLPFVFAIWMAPADAELGPLPEQLDALRQANADRLEQIVQQHAPQHDWPIGLARQYLTQILQYEIGPRHVQAIERFASLAHRHGVIDKPPSLVFDPQPAT